jgi:Kef-type K+ transport system membrane component KefB
MHSDILLQIAIAIVGATVCAIIARWTRQPLILGYILAGIIIGPAEGLGWISTEEIEPISELGLILLLFMIGLEIDLKKLRDAGRTMVAVGIGQFVICVGLGLAVFPSLGFPFGDGGYAPLYLAVAAALSSTMIVVKLLYDKSELDTAAGRITLGILVFQDIWAILFLALQENLHDPTVGVLVVSLAKGAGLVAFALLASRFVLPVLFRSIAKVPELLVIGALAWCFFVVLIASDLGLSREMGALIAGISLSTFPYNLDVVAKVISLRDFFITLFFVTLGTKIPRPTTDLLLVATAGSVFLVASRFLSIVPILQLFRRGNRGSILPAINLSQLSEFSLVICTLGLGLGHIGPEVLAVVVFMLVITSVGSTYAILWSSRIVDWINPWLKRLGMHDLDDTPLHMPPELAKPIVFVGFYRVASSLLHELLAWNPQLVDEIGVVDFNPQVKEELDRRGIYAVYGDISHLDTLYHANVHHAQVLLCTIPDSLLKGTNNLRLLRKLRGLAPDATIVVTAEVLEQARELYRAGATFVYSPRLMSVRELAEVVLDARVGHVDDARREAREGLFERAEVLP